MYQRRSNSTSSCEEAEVTNHHDSLLVPAWTSTPYKSGTSDGVIRYLDESGRGLTTLEASGFINELFEPPRDWINPKPWVDKFVDDVNGGQAHLVQSGTAHFSTQKERRSIHAKECQNIYETVVQNATVINMKVNPKKTKMLCVSSATNCDVISYIYVNGCLLYTSPSPRDRQKSRMPSSA